MFTQDEFAKLIEAMRSGLYKKCERYFIQDGKYCTLGLAATVNGHNFSYFYDLDMKLGEKVGAENDDECGEDFTRMMEWCLSHQHELVKGM